MSEELKNDVIANTARVEDIFGIDNRAARGYGLVYTCVKIYQRLLPDLFQENDLTEASFNE